MSALNIIDPETAWLLAQPAVRAYSDLPGLTNNQKNERASHAWAVITSFGPLSAYGIMLVAHSLPLNEMLGDAAHDAIVESKQGMMPGQESRMKQRSCTSYVGLHRALTQNMTTFVRMTKETSPPPPRETAAARRAAKAETEKPMAVTAEAERPMAVTAQTERPMAAKAESERPIAAKAESERPKAVTAETERPMAAKAESERPIAGKAESERPKTVTAEAERPMAAKQVDASAEPAAPRPRDAEQEQSDSSHPTRSGAAAPGTDQAPASRAPVNPVTAASPLVLLAGESHGDETLPRDNHRDETSPRLE